MAKEISLLDDLLIKAAAGGKSGDEMERITGIPAAQAVTHVKQLLAGRDIWTEQEQRQLLLVELNELKDSLQDQALKAKDPDAARLLLKTLETIGKRLDAQQTNINENMLKLTEFQSRVMIKAMDAALSFAKKQLAEQFPDVDIIRLDELVAEGLQIARYELAEDEQN